MRCKVSILARAIALLSIVIVASGCGSIIKAVYGPPVDAVRTAFRLANDTNSVTLGPPPSD
jgi:uncharacterized protein YceK